MIGTNIPGMYDYTQQKQKARIETGPYSGMPTSVYNQMQQQPSQGPAQMGNYINRQTATSLAAPTPQAPYMPTATPQGGPQTPYPAPGAPTAQAAPVQPATPAVATYPTPTAQPSLPQAGPTPRAGAQGSSLQDPGQITDPGRAYAARVAQNLQGNNPLVQNAQQTEDTAASRRAYTSRKATAETLAQTPFAQGSAQYQRAMDQSQAGVNQANQAGQAEVNQFTRQATADNMAAANNLEDQQYSRAIGERTNSQQQSSQLAQQIKDPKALYAFQRAVASGVDPKVAFQSIVGETGTINDGYRGQSPVENVKQDATDWVKSTTDLKEGDPAFTAAVRARMEKLDKSVTQPVDDTIEVAEVKVIKGLLANGVALTPTQITTAASNDLIPPLTAQTIPTGSDNVQAFLKTNPSGLFMLEGKPYKLVGGDRIVTRTDNDLGYGKRTKAYATFEDPKTGEKTYVLDGGEVTKKKPEGY